MSMAQRYAGYLEREAFKAATPVKAEAMRQVRAKHPGLIEGSSGWHRAVENRRRRLR